MFQPCALILNFCSLQLSSLSVKTLVTETEIQLVPKRGPSHIFTGQP